MARAVESIVAAPRCPERFYAIGIDADLALDNQCRLTRNHDNAGVHETFSIEGFDGQRFKVVWHTGEGNGAGRTD